MLDDTMQDPLLPTFGTNTREELQICRSRNNTIMFKLMVLLIFNLLPGLTAAMSSYLSNQKATPTMDAFFNWGINNMFPLFLLSLCLIWWIYSNVIDCCCSKYLNGCLNDEAIPCGGWFLREFPRAIAAMGLDYLENQLKETDRQLQVAKQEKTVACKLCVQTATANVQGLTGNTPSRIEAQRSEMDNTENEPSNSVILGTTSTSPPEAVRTTEDTNDNRVASFVTASRDTNIERLPCYSITIDRRGLVRDLQEIVSDMTSLFKVKPRNAEHIISIIVSGARGRSIPQQFSIPVYDEHDEYKGKLQITVIG